MFSSPQYVIDFSTNQPSTVPRMRAFVVFLVPSSSTRITSFCCLCNQARPMWWYGKSQAAPRWSPHYHKKAQEMLLAEAASPILFLRIFQQEDSKPAVAIVLSNNPAGSICREKPVDAGSRQVLHLVQECANFHHECHTRRSILLHQNHILRESDSDLLESDVTIAYANFQDRPVSGSRLPSICTKHFTNTNDSKGAGHTLGSVTGLLESRPDNQSLRKYPDFELLLRPRQHSDDIKMSQQHLLASLGLAVIDDIHFRSGAVVKDELGVSATYCELRTALLRPFSRR